MEDSDDINTTLTQFVTSAQEAFMFENGDTLAQIFVYEDNLTSVLGSMISDIPDLDSYTALITDDDFAQFTLAYIKYAQQVPQTTANPQQRGKLMYSIVDAFVPLFSKPGHHWLVPLMKTTSFALFHTARLIDRTSNTNEAYIQAAARLQSILQVVLSDRNALPNSKHAGAYFVASLLIRVSIRVGAMPPAHAAVSNISKANLDFGYFGARDQVTYRYWVGRYHLVCYRVQAARESLEYAFSKCPVRFSHNKRVILRHLFVANMIRGVVPRTQLLDKHHMEPVYYELARHFRSGDIFEFQRCLDENMEFFRAQGNYLILRERTEVLMFRTVLSRLYRTLCIGGHRPISYSEVLCAFRATTRDQSMDVLEMESILASLVSQKYVRGYLFHHQAAVNLARKSPFPLIKSVGLPGGVKG